MPRRAGSRARRLENHQRQIPLADGRRLSRRSSGLCRHRRHRIWAGHGSAHHAGAEGGGLGQEPVRRQGCAAQDPRCALAEARACRRNRIRRLYRWRQYPAGRVQGLAAGQAGRGDRGGDTVDGQDRKAFRQNGWQAASTATTRQLAQIRGEVRRGDGRGDFKARQGAVAGRRRRQGASPSSIWRAISRRSANG